MPAGVTALFCSAMLMFPLRPPTVKTLEATEESKTSDGVAVEPLKSGVSCSELKASALEFFRTSVPPVTVLLPRKVLAPESVRVPRPALVSPPPTPVSEPFVVA